MNSNYFKNSILLLSLLFLSIAQAQVTSGLVSSYSFNNGDAKDETGSNDGTVTGAVLTEDRFGNSNKAYIFNGDDYIDCGNDASFNNLTTQFSISAWFKRAAGPNSFEAIVAKWDFFTGEHFLLATRTQKAAWAVGGPGNAGTNDIALFKKDTWNHVVMLWDLTGKFQMYMNNKISTNRQLTASNISNTTSVVYIGSQSSTTRYFNGSIDDVRIYNRVLTPSEIDTLYEMPNPTTLSRNDITSDDIKPSYPNPTTGILNFNSVVNVHLRNQLGQIVLDVKNSKTIDITTQPPGVYYLSLYTSEGILTSRERIVKI